MKFKYPQFHLPRDTVCVHVRTKATRVPFPCIGAPMPRSLETRSPPKIAREVGWLTYFEVGMAFLGLARMNESVFRIIREPAYFPWNLSVGFYLFT